MMRTRTLLAVVTITAISLLAACGDDSDSSDAAGGAGTTPAAADTTAGAADTTAAGTDTTAGGEATDETSGEPTGPGKDTEFCQYQKELNDMATPFDDRSSGPAEFEQYFTELVGPAIGTLEDTAPDEIKEQMTVLAEGLRKFAATFEQNGWDPAKAYADPALADLANDAAYNEAGAAVDQFCGF